MQMRWMAGLALVVVACGSALAGEAAFTKKPVATAAGDSVKIEFAVGKATDVTVDILDAKGAVVRHLAAGMLGDNPPAPLVKGLAQSITWDRKDDDGKPVSGSVNVRVQLGVGVALDRFIPRSSERITAPTAIGVGANGDVYVLSGLGHESAYIYVLDRAGKYLRTILPPPATLKPEQLKGEDRIKLTDGTEVPMVFQANAAHLAPFLSGMRTQQLFVTQQGWICFASGGNDYSDQHVLRHVLVVKPDGSTPAEVGFVGPSLGPSGRYSIGLRPTQVAVSPDGKTIYCTGLGINVFRDRPAKGIHAICRTTWDSTEHPKPFIGNPDVPGNNGTHLNDPVGLTCDAKGAIYIADAGNSRVAAFDPTGKFLGETTVDTPAQVAVHPAGALYALSVIVPWKPGKTGSFALVKLDKAIGGKEVARYAFAGRTTTFALDAGATPPKLWLGIDGRIMPVTDNGGTLTVGENVVKAVENGLRSPLFMTADPGRNRLYVADRTSSRRGVDIFSVDLKTDTVAPFFAGSEAAVDKDGNVYVLVGYATKTPLVRLTPDGKPAPFSGTGSNSIDLRYRAGLPNVGVRGLTVAPSGDLYAWEDSLTTGRMRLWRFGPDGKPKGEPVIDGIPGDSANSVAVDRAGNIYAGINVHDAKALYPPAFGSAIPPMAWERTYSAQSGWYSTWPQRGVPPAPWSRMYLNYYLYHYGNVFKFPPAGGTFWMGGTPVKSGVNDRPDTVPADATEYRVGFLKNVVWEKGALWRYPGFALSSNRTESSGDPTCSCWSGRFGLDESGLLFVPDVFRFSVGVLDANGNELTRFGQYGNVDSAGPKSAVPTPAIPLAWANTVSVGGGKVYVADRINRRIAVLTVTHAAEEMCAVK